MPTIVYRDGGLDPALLWNPFSLFHWPQLAWPQFDVDDTEDETVLTADVPGLHDEDLEVFVSGAELIVRGERKPSGRGRRRPVGAFERRFKLADGYDLDRVDAHLADGVLEIRLPKLPKAKPRRIKLSSGPRSMVEKVKGLLSGDKDAKDQDK